MEIDRGDDARTTGSRDLHGDRRLGALAQRIVAGELDPYRAADELVASLTE